MKSIKRIVDTEIWNSQVFIEEFTPEDKYFYLYLLTNTHTSQLGVYKIVKKLMAFETGYSIDTINLLIDRFENTYGMIKYNRETSEISIKNYLKHSIVKGGKPVFDCLIKDSQKVVDKNLIEFAVTSLLNDEEVSATIKDFIKTLNIDSSNDDEQLDNESSQESSEKSILTEKDEKGFTLEDKFNYLWKQYPKPSKGSKKKSFKMYVDYITKGKTYLNKKYKFTEKQIYNAIMKYIKERQDEGTELQYYKNFETLMNQIADYVEE